MYVRRTETETGTGTGTGTRDKGRDRDRDRDRGRGPETERARERKQPEVQGLECDITDKHADGCHRSITQAISQHIEIRERRVV